MKKTITRIIAMFLLIGLLSNVYFIEECVAANGFGGGNGTPENPYMITTKAQLCSIAQYPDAHYILMRDLVFYDTDYTDSGLCPNGWQSIENFTGTFNGCGNKIVNLQGTNGGFVKTNSGTIDSVVFKNHQLTGEDEFGSVANINKGFITHCYVDLNISESNAQATECAGGIVGTNSGTISYCQATGLFSFLGPQYKYCWIFAGGVAGSSSGTIKSCYNNTDLNLYSPYITEYIHIGGIAGQGYVEDCRNDGSMYIRASMDYDIYASAFGGYHNTPVNCYGNPNYSGYSYYYRVYTYDAKKNPSCYDLSEVTDVTKLFESTFKEFDFNEKWMITPNGPMPQGIMDADGNCYSKYSYTAPTCVEEGLSVYKNQYGEQKSETLPAIGHEPNADGQGCLRDGCEENIITSLTLDTVESTVYMNETLQLTAKYTPSNATDKTLVWTSYDSNVATVDESGMVTAIKPGETFIEVSAVGGATAKCNITVLANETAYPESEHDYSSDSDAWGYYTHYGKGVNTLTIKFSEQSHLEDYWDYVYVHDAGGNLVKTYTGTEISGAELTVNGNSFSIHLTSDGSGNFYGYSIESVTPNYCEIIPIESMYIGIDYNDYYIDPVRASIGDTIKLSCEVYPENTTSYVIWSSSDASVATVKGGVLTVTGYGETIITAKSSDGLYSSDYYINIYGPTYINAESITLNPGETFKLECVKSYNLNDYNDYHNAYSSNETVATVEDDGTVHAIGPGEASIGYNGFSCYVYVSDSYYTRYIVDGTYTLLAGQEYSLPITGNTEEYLWGYSYDDEIAEYNSDTRTITAKREGQTDIYTDYGYLNIRVIEPYVKCVYTVENGIITSYEGNGESLVIPEEIDGETIVGIGEYAFRNGDFKSIEIPGTVKEIGMDAFWGCTNLENVVINEGVEIIDEYAFYSCTNINEIFLPSTLKTVGYRALADLSSEDISYNGLKTDWINMNIGDDNDCLECLSETYGKIYNAEELYMIADAVNSKASTHNGKTFKLMNNISLNNAEWTPIGIYEYDYAFAGNFIGNGYTISDFKITNENRYNGFFGATTNAEISGLNIKNATIDLSFDYDENVYTQCWTGLFIGWNYYSSITNCTASGTITIANDTNDDNIGGFAGRMSGGQISNCEANTKIRVKGGIGTGDCVGGLTGYMYGTISSCSSTADIHYEGNSNYAQIGGVVGYQAQDSTKIEGCTAKGNINAIFGDTDNIYLGGVVGRNNKTVSNNISYMNIVYSSKNSINVGTIWGYDYSTNSNNQFYGSINRVPYACFSAVSEASGKHEYNYSIKSLEENENTIILALYSKDRFLECIFVDSKEMAGSVCLPEKPDNYKIFVWSDINSIIPRHNALYGAIE